MIGALFCCYNGKIKATSDSHSTCTKQQFMDSSETLSRLFRDSSETLPRLFRDSSETLPRLFRDSSETLPRQKNWRHFYGAENLCCAKSNNDFYYCIVFSSCSFCGLFGLIGAAKRFQDCVFAIKEIFPTIYYVRFLFSKVSSRKRVFESEFSKASSQKWVLEREFSKASSQKQVLKSKFSIASSRKQVLKSEFSKTSPRKRVSERGFS
jgi:hypothetical protein